MRFESFNGILHEKQSVFRKEMASTPTTVPVRGGYTFAGWCDQAGVPFEASTVPITSNRTIYAKWTPNTYTLRYDAGEGTLEVTEQKLTYGTPFTMPVPSLAGRRFVGWSRTQGATEAEFLPSVYQQGIVTANGAILTLYAVYE